MPRIRAVILASCASLFVSGLSSAAELVVLQQPGCAWCARFESEIAPAWPKTAEGALAPLRRVDITESWPEDLAGVSKEHFTPTFILMDGGSEVARLRGYVGDEFFWYRIGELMALLENDDS